MLHRVSSRKSVIFIDHSVRMSIAHINLCGEATVRHVRRFETLRKKKAKVCLTLSVEIQRQSSGSYICYAP